MLFLTPVYLIAPDAVAEEIRPRLSSPEAGKAGQAHDLGIALGLVAHATGHPTAFHDAIAALVEAALVSTERTDARRPGYLATLDPQRPARLVNVATALQARHHITGNSDDAQEATGP